MVAAEVTATTNDQPHFVPVATAVIDKPRRCRRRHAWSDTLVADAGYWTAANGTVDVAGANVLIATKKSSWRKAAKPDDDKLAVLAKVNRGELSQRQAGEMLGVSYTWVRDMTKRYFGHDGQRLTRQRRPRTRRVDPRDRTSSLAARCQNASAKDQLCVSDSRINAMLAHVRGEATEPSIVLKDAGMPSSPNPPTPTSTRNEGSDHRTRLRQHQSQSRLPAIHVSAACPPSTGEWRLICTAHNLLKLRQAGIG